MKLLSFKVASGHLLLCVFLSLLLDVTDSNTTKLSPENVKAVEVLGQSETSITLRWEKVNSISTYRLQYENNGIPQVEEINASDPVTSVTYEVSSLTAGTKYSFTLFTVFEGVSSTGYTFQAITTPLKAEEFKAVTQNETSITLQWNKVDGFSNYIFKYNEEENCKCPKSPENVKAVKVSGQSETSITLRWEKVNSISTYRLQYEDKVEEITVSDPVASVTYEVSSLTAGTKYNFTLFTVFEGVSSTGYTFQAATIPSAVTSVNAIKRSTTNITLEWNVDVDKDWSYFLQMNEDNVTLHSVTGVVSHTFTSLQPGREYPFSVITQFSGLNSTAYEDSAVTRIDCASVQWHVTNSSIEGVVEGLFTNATATNKSQEHVSPGGPNVLFTGLYPGATYEVYLWYENKSKPLEQCNHSLTIIPPRLSPRCEYWASGYSVRITWNKPDGVWTAVEVNVTGETYTGGEDGEEHIEIPGFQPARTYNVSLASLSGTERGSEQRSEPVVFSCPTDPRGVIAGSVLAVLLFVVLVCLIVFILIKRPDIISRKKPVIVGSKQSNKKCKTISEAKFPDHFYQLSGDDNRGFSQEYESLIPVGTKQTQKIALLPANKVRNRLDDVLPYDRCRVKLTNAPSDYINASYIPGYNSDREYIATQGPLLSTVNDFWRMIWEQRVKDIVMVTNCTEGGRTKCEQYWPADSHPCLYGELTVTMNPELQEPNWTLREFRMKHSKTSEERTVRHFHFTAWPDHGVPQGTEVLIQFRGLVRQHIQREGAGAPTVVHCSAGVGRTGTIIALDVLLQQLEKERAVGINDFVHKMRLSRPHMVQTESLYIFLHQCVMDCLQTNEMTEENIYENPDMIYANAIEIQEFHKNV